MRNYLNYLKYLMILNRCSSALAAVSHANRSKTHTNFRSQSSNTENALHSERYYRSFIFLSSSMVYGNFKKIVNEEDKCEPLGVYAALKYSAEKIIRVYNQVLICHIL